MEWMGHIVKDLDSVKEPISRTKETFNTGGDISRILQQLDQLIQSDSWSRKEIINHGESPHSSKFDNTRFFKTILLLFRHTGCVHSFGDSWVFAQYNENDLQKAL